MNYLPRISFMYGALVSALSAVMLVYFLTRDSDNGVDIWFFPCLLLCHGLAQMVYSSVTRQRLGLPKYEYIDTLDNDFTFSGGPSRIYENSSAMVFLAVFASVVELGLVFVAVNSVRNIGQQMSSDDAYTILWSVMHVIAILGAVPSVIYNLRTWNMKRILVDSED